MSASLVGSEMCIRDRSASPLLGPARTLVDRAASRSWSRCPITSLKPVNVSQVAAWTSRCGGDRQARAT
eukprot:11887048-Alexandrium_andersonii.AAC.1